MANQRKKRPFREEEPISGAYPAIDNDLARDNLENDIPAADLEDLRSGKSTGEVN